MHSHDWPWLLRQSRLPQRRQPCFQPPPPSLTCFLFPVGAQFQMASLGGAMAAVLGIICLMITGVAVRARQVRDRTACLGPTTSPHSCHPGDLCYSFSGYIRHYKTYLDLFKFHYISNNQSMTYNFQEYARALDNSSSFY